MALAPQAWFLSNVDTYCHIWLELAKPNLQLLAHLLKRFAACTAQPLEAKPPARLEGAPGIEHSLVSQFSCVGKR